ncbi:MAG: histidine phosphatase family protein [Firmicutes bacterium]|nr:histidine phosphatase family protein [Bacillota bacterium]
MSSKLYVLHHSKPEKIPGLAPAAWRLSRVGVMLAIPIAEASFWSTVNAIYHCPALAAMQTAQIVAGRWQMPIRQVADLGRLPMQELTRGLLGQRAGSGNLHFDKDYTAAQERIVRCVHRLAQQNVGYSFAIVSHRRTIAALYSHLLGRQITREECRSLRMPDLSVVDLETWQVIDGFLCNK